MDIQNYNPATVSGESWQRANAIHIENPSGGVPTLEIIEQRVTLLSDSRQIVESVGSLTAVFDPTNPLHGQLYYLLNELYVTLREARDAQIATAPAEPGQEALPV